MFHKGAYLVLAVYLLLYQSPVHGEILGCVLKQLLECLVCLFAGEVCIGTLPDLTGSYDIDGELCIIDQSTMELRDFSYDGRGPG